MQVTYRDIEYQTSPTPFFTHEWEHLRHFLLGCNTVLTKAPEPNVLHWHQRGHPVFAITFPSVLECVMAHRDYIEALARKHEMDELVDRALRKHPPSDFLAD